MTKYEKRHSLALNTTRLLTLLAALGLAACGKPPAREEEIRPVRTITVNAGATATANIYAGEVRPRYESDLGFRVSGKILSRSANVGDTVKAGQLLARLDASDMALNEASQRAQLNSLDAQLNVARLDYERNKALFDEGVIGAAGLDHFKATYDAAKAQVEASRAQVRAMSNQTGYSELRADHDGVITAISAEAGQVVAAGQSVANLARDGEREVEISVPEGRIADYRKEQTATVELWAESGKRIDGMLREIAPEADATTRTYRVRVALGEGSDAVKLGQTARVYFAGAGGDDAHVIPLASLYEKDGKPAVWVLDPKTRQVHLKPVTVSAYREQGVLLTAGVDTQDWIIAAGVHKLREGQPVAPVDGGNRPLSL